MRFIERLKDRIELESDEALEKKRYDYSRGLQRLYEFVYDLREAFGAKLFGGAVDHTFRWLQDQDGSFKDMGRGRFFRLVGPIKIPLTPVKE